MKKTLICLFLLLSAWLLTAHNVKTEGKKYIVSHEWECKGQKWSVKIPVNKDLYNYYKNEREHSGFNYPGYAMSEYDRQFLQVLISAFRKSGDKKSLTDFEVVQNIVAFVQSLQYVTDKKSTGLDNYVRFPVETIVDGIGDCEDFAILVAALIDEMGYSVVLLQLPNHLAVAIACEDFAGGTYYNYKGMKYYYLETTNPGWDIGEIPSDYKNVSAEICPLVREPVVKISSSKYNVTYTDSEAGFDITCSFKNYGPLRTKGTYLYVETVYNGKVVANNIKYLEDVIEGKAKEYSIHLDARNYKNFTLNIVVGGDNFDSDSYSYSISLK